MPRTRSAPRPPRYADLAPHWRTCLEQAWESFRNGSLPIGAVIVDASGQEVAVGRNRLAEAHEGAPHLPETPYLTGTPLAHAEVNAILQMGYDRPQPRPTLFTTTEPCPLCMGAARMAGIGRIVFAARDVWAGASSMAQSVPYIARMGPTVEGPDPALEEPLIAWLLAHGSPAYRSGPFAEAWRERFPKAVEVAAELGENGVLHELAEQGVERVWEALIAALEGYG